MTLRSSASNYNAGAVAITGGNVTTAALSVTSTAQIGDQAADTVAFYGATPIVQRGTAASHTVIATTQAVSTTTLIITSWGFSTAAQANAMIAAIAEIQSTLLALGIWAA